MAHPVHRVLGGAATPTGGTAHAAGKGAPSSARRNRCTAPRATRPAASSQSSGTAATVDQPWDVERVEVQQTQVIVSE